MNNKYIYRIRKISNILGDNGELKNQYIYFAKPEQLNDPLEGYKDIVWIGDKIVWKNLLKHYLLCLVDIIKVCIDLKEDQCLNEEHINVKLKYDDFTNTYRRIIDDIYFEFFSHEYINELINMLGSRTAPTRKNELIFLISAIHEYALEIVFKVMKKRKVIDKKIFSNKTISLNIEKLKLIFKDLDSIYKCSQFSEEDEKIDLMFKTFREMRNEIKIITLLNEEDIEKRDKFYFIYTEFTDKYVKKLAQLLFPQWYTACFMSNCKNSSVWGHYGEGHRGVCLKYRIQHDYINDNFTLNLQLGTSDAIKKADVNRFIPMKLYKIKYEKKFVEVNFFRSLGHYTFEELKKQWYQDDDGTLSECAEGILTGGKDEWRKNYWNKHINTVTTKSKDWEYENEYRIILEGDSSSNYSKGEKRQIKYDFNDLEGVIFGINTSLEDKIEIIKIVKNKCKEIGRKNFSFYQAEYNYLKGEIYYTKLDLISIHSDV